jgi:hypothetical protein
VRSFCYEPYYPHISTSWGVIGNRIFLLDDLIFSNKYMKSIKEIINILDLGFNFVPCQHLNILNVFYNTIKDFDIALLKFNTNLFFKKLKDKNNCKNSANAVVNNTHETFEFSSELSSCSDFSCIFNKMRKKTFENIPFLSESLEFRFQFIKELAKHKIVNKVNLSRDQFYALKFFIKHKADKNIGAVIISENLEKELAFKSLNNTSSFTKLDSNPLTSTNTFIHDKLITLHNEGHLSFKCMNYLFVETPKCG